MDILLNFKWNVMRAKVVLFYVQKRDGGLVELGRVSVREEPDDEAGYVALGKGVGIEGWNYCSVTGSGADVGGEGYPREVIEEFWKGDGKLAIKFVDGYKAGGCVSPAVPGYELWVDEVEEAGEAPSGSNGEIGVADRLGLKTKKELLELAGEYGKSSMKKDELVEVIIKHDLY